MHFKGFVSVVLVIRTPFSDPYYFWMVQDEFQKLEAEIWENDII